MSDGCTLKTMYPNSKREMYLSCVDIVITCEAVSGYQILLPYHCSYLIETG
jgi:hypothetical protein